jgi:ABC-2 type transport system ATP-binding protein
VTRDFSATQAIRVRGLTRRYGHRLAVNSLDLDVHLGDVYGFLGPNGSGKTTAIRCMVGLIARDAGEIEICGEKNPMQQRQYIGAMVETPRFYEWLNARVNLELVCAYAGVGSRDDIDRALSRVGLLDRAKEKVGGFSLGMKQRLGIARAIVARPRVLILDEPTNGLDPRGMREVRELLKDLAKTDGLTVFVSSHLLSEVEQLCNRVAILDGGKLVSEGYVAELKEKTQGQRLVDLELSGENVQGVLAEISGVKLAGAGEAGRIRVALSGCTAAELNRRLVGAGLEVGALVPVEGSLEDVYLASTRQEASIQ